MSTEKITFENRKCNCQHAICRGGSAARNLTGQSGSLNDAGFWLRFLASPGGKLADLTALRNRQGWLMRGGDM